MEVQAEKIKAGEGSPSLAQTIEQAIERYWESQKTVYPVHANNASQVGHPCVRYLYYLRTAWEQKLLPETRMLRIFHEGNIQEEAVIDVLKKAGFEIIEQQRPFWWDTYKISGRIDGRIRLAGKSVIFEIKSVSPYSFDKLNSIKDILQAEWYYRKWIAQLQLYMLLGNEEFSLLILKNKSTGVIKVIEVPLDYDFAESLLKKVELVNQAVESGEVPPKKVNDVKICKDCPFRHICGPELVGDAVKISEQEEIAEKLARWQELQDEIGKKVEELKKLDKEIKEWAKKQKEKKLLVGEWYIEKKPYMTTTYQIPDEIKEKYKKKVERIRIEIQQI